MSDIRTFTEFNTSSGDICPICGTDEDADIILVPIAGTHEDGLVETIQVHLKCVVNNLLYYPRGDVGPGAVGASAKFNCRTKVKR